MHGKAKQAKHVSPSGLQKHLTNISLEPVVANLL
jgi:hypothetical protein